MHQCINCIPDSHSSGSSSDSISEERDAKRWLRQDAVAYRRCHIVVWLLKSGRLLSTSTTSTREQRRAGDHNRGKGKKKANEEKKITANDQMKEAIDILLSEDWKKPESVKDSQSVVEMEQLPENK